MRERTSRQQKAITWRTLLEVAALICVGFGLTFASPSWLAERLVRAPGDLPKWIIGRPVDPYVFDAAERAGATDDANTQQGYSAGYTIGQELPPVLDEQLVPLYWPPVLHHEAQMRARVQETDQ